MGHDRFEGVDRDFTTTFTNPASITTFKVKAIGSADTDDAAWHVVGGAWLDEYFGVELGYVNLGETSLTQQMSTTRTSVILPVFPVAFFVPGPGTFVTSTDGDSSVNLTGCSMLAKTRYPFFRNTEIVLSLVAVRWDLEGKSHVETSFTRRAFFGGSIQGISSVESIDEHDFDFDFDLVFGVGVNRKLSDSLEFRLEWTRYEVGALVEHVDFIGFRAQYYFHLPATNVVVTSRYWADSPTLLDSVGQMRPFNTSQTIISRQWTYFVNVAGGLAEHDSTGDSDDESLRSTTIADLEVTSFSSLFSRSSTTVRTTPSRSTKTQSREEWLPAHTLTII